MRTLDIRKRTMQSATNKKCNNFAQRLFFGIGGVKGQNLYLEKLGSYSKLF
jgi:hypothetical protein